MKRAIFPVTFFAIAMGFLESAVVVYLRAIYYPEGFSFPLKIIEGTVAYTEILRETATLVMLITVAILTARSWLIRFAWFIYMFAIWDIFYYLFLWILLGWPDSLFTWDVLFLIPTTWVGPVLAPVVNSLTMILLALAIILADRRTAGLEGQRNVSQVRLTSFEWGCLTAGSLITVLTYTLDYSRYMLERFSLTEWISLSGQAAVLQSAAEYIPVSFNWWLFSSGTLLFVISIACFLWRCFSGRSGTSIHLSD